MKVFLKSKIHHAKVTHKNQNYVGSIFIDQWLLEKSNLAEHERVDVFNVTNGNRWTTYVGAEPKHSGFVRVNGAGARLCEPGDTLIIVAYELLDDLKQKPKMILVDDNNEFVKYL